MEVDLWAKNALIHVLVVSCLSAAVSSVIGDDHSPQVLVHLQLVFSTLLVVYIFELIQVHRVHFEVLHVHLVLYLHGCFSLHVV